MKKVTKEVKDKIIKWYANGSVGSSSSAMASCIAGVNGHRSHPLDPADLNRCLLFLEAVPEAREQLPRLKKLSPVWAEIVDSWDLLEKTFLEEVGLDWSKGRDLKAIKTYQMMKSLGC